MKKILNKSTKEVGITLIALVVTMIILLILAGVTIGVATNGTGLFEKAKLATDEYNNKAQQEETELAKIANQINSNIDGNRDTVTIQKEEYEQLKNANTFSEDEKVIGKWNNGKTLYQKSFFMTSQTINLDDLNIENIHDITGVVHDATYDFPVGYSDKDGWMTTINYHKANKILYIYIQKATFVSADITIKYTKITNT